MVIEERIQQLGLTLPDPPGPLANYVTVNRTGNLLYTSGNGCFVDGKPVYLGRLGAEITIEDGYEAARLTALNLLSVLKGELGDLSRIKKVVKLLGFVSSTDDFFEQPAVIDGASDLLVQVLGDRGKHARSAIGTSVLPMNIPVEIELIVEIEEEVQKVSI